MVRYRELKTNFVAGEFDDLLEGRSDIKHYFNGADLLRNVVVLPQGGVRVRPGSRYMWTVPEVPLIDGGGPSNIRLASFQFSTEQAYLFVFHHKRCSIFRNEVLVFELITPYSSDELCAEVTADGAMISAGISWAQSLDTMIVFHEEYQPRQIQRTGSHTSWSLSLYTLTNIPTRAFPGGVYVNGVDEVQNINFPIVGEGGDWRSGDTFKLILEDEETDNIVYLHDLAAMAAEVQAALRALPNTNNGVTVTGIVLDATHLEIQANFINGDGKRPWGSMGYRVISSQQAPTIDIYVTTPGVRAGEAVWSGARGWPRCGCFFQGRLFMAGSYSLPNTVWASRSGAPNDFNNKRQSVDYGFEFSSDTDDVPAFLAIYPGRHLQFFSTAGEFYVPSSESEAVTPENFALRRTTSRGMRPGLPVFEVDGGTLFVQRLGKTLREFIFADAESAYQANSVSLLSSHLMRNPVGMAMRKSSSTDAADYIFMANSDGTMTVFCTLRTQEVNAYTLWNTAGSYLDVKTVLDTAYTAVERMVDGSPVRFIEVVDEAAATDCAVLGSGVSSTGTAAHLGTQEVDILLDGYVQPRGEMVAGVVPFGRPTVSSYEVGLPWPDAHPDYPGYRWLVRTLPPEQSLSDGTMSGRKRRVSNVSMMLHETTGIIVQRNRVAFQQFGAHLLDQPVPVFTGRKRVPALLGWSYDGKLAIGDTIPTRATITQLSYAVSV